MFPLRNRIANRSPKNISARRRTHNALRLEGLEDRVVFSASSVSVPAAVSMTEGASYKPVITRTGDLSQPVTLNYSFAQSTANGQDFSREKYSGTVTLNPGVKTYTLLPVTAVDDRIDEYDQDFYLYISVAGNSSTTVSNQRTKLTIKDNDAAPNVSIAPVVAAKNEDGGNAYFRVSIDAPSEKDVYVELEGRSVGMFTWGKDAAMANGWDGKLQPVTIKAGETYKDFAVAIQDDKIVENTEYLQVAFTKGHNISGFSNVKAEVAIKDNDVPTVVIDDAGSITEGNTAGAAAKFKVRVLEQLERTVHVKYWTSTGEATNAADYVSKSGTLTFGGDPALSVVPPAQIVSVALKADTVKEATAERFYLGVGPVDATAANKVYVPKTYGKATIVDDDAPKPTGVGTPMPISATPTPENGFGMVQYRWAAASNAVRYEVYVRKENSLSGSRYTNNDLEGFGKAITQTTYSPIYTDWLQQGTYLWKVRAIAADGTEGAWSTEQRFEMPEKFASR